MAQWIGAARGGSVIKVSFLIVKCEHVFYREPNVAGIMCLCTLRQRSCPQEEEDHEAALKGGLSQHVLLMLAGRCLSYNVDKCLTLLQHLRSKQENQLS